MKEYIIQIKNLDEDTCPIWIRESQIIEVYFWPFRGEEKEINIKYLVFPPNNIYYRNVLFFAHIDNDFNKYVTFAERRKRISKKLKTSFEDDIYFITHDQYKKMVEELREYDIENIEISR